MRKDNRWTVAVFRNEDWIKGFDFPTEHEANVCYWNQTDTLDQLGQIDGEEISDQDGCYQFDCYLPSGRYHQASDELTELCGPIRDLDSFSVVFIPPGV